MIIKSNEISVSATKKRLQEFLSTSANYELLLPIDKITHFTATESTCSFKIQGGITIELIQDGHDETGAVLLKSGEGSPFPFQLKINLEEENYNTKGDIVFNGELNTFLAMVATKPLQNLFNYMAEKIIEHFTVKS